MILGKPEPQKNKRQPLLCKTIWNDRIELILFFPGQNRFFCSGKGYEN